VEINVPDQKIRLVIVVLLSVLLLAFIAVSVFLYYRAAIQEKSLNSGQSSLAGAIQEPLKPCDPDSPINKLVKEDTGYTEYRLRGTITSKAELNTGIIHVNFQIDDDPLNREIFTYMGALDGQMLAGYCDDPNCQTGTWKVYPTSDIIPELTVGRQVVLSLTFPYQLSDDHERQKDLLDREWIKIWIRIKR